MTRWQGSPQYLKHLRKIQNMDPSRKAITRGMIDDLTGMYAGADMQRQLQAMRQASVEDERESRLDLMQGRHDLAKKQYEHQEDVDRTAEILGYANIPLAALSGYGDMKSKKKMAGLYQGLADRS